MRMVAPSCWAPPAQHRVHTDAFHTVLTVNRCSPTAAPRRIHRPRCYAAASRRPNATTLSCPCGLLRCPRCYAAASPQPIPSYCSSATTVQLRICRAPEIGRQSRPSRSATTIPPSWIPLPACRPGAQRSSIDRSARRRVGNCTAITPAATAISGTYSTGSTKHWTAITQEVNGTCHPMCAPAKTARARRARTTAPAAPRSAARPSAARRPDARAAPPSRGHCGSRRAGRGRSPGRPGGGGARGIAGGGPTGRRRREHEQPRPAVARPRDAGAPAPESAGREHLVGLIRRRYFAKLDEPADWWAAIAEISA